MAVWSLLPEEALCFKSDDPDDLAEKIEELGSDYKLRSELTMFYSIT